MLNDSSFINNYYDSVDGSSPLGTYGMQDRTAGGISFNQFYDEADTLNKSGTTCAASGSRGDSLPWVGAGVEGGSQIAANEEGRPFIVGGAAAGGTSTFVSDIVAQTRCRDITSFMDGDCEFNDVSRNVPFSLPSDQTTTTTAYHERPQKTTIPSTSLAAQYRFHINVEVEKIQPKCSERTCTSFGDIYADVDNDVDDECCRLASLKEFVLNNLRTKRDTTKSTIANKNSGVMGLSSEQPSPSSLPSSVPVDVQAHIIANYLLSYHRTTPAVSFDRSESSFPISLAPLTPRQQTPSSSLFFNRTSPPRKTSPRHYDVSSGSQAQPIGSALTAFKAFDKAAALSIEAGSICRPSLMSQQKTLSLSLRQQPQFTTSLPHAPSTTPSDLSFRGGISLRSGGVGFWSPVCPQSVSTSTVIDDPSRSGSEDRPRGATSSVSSMIPQRSGGGWEQSARPTPSQHRWAMSCSRAEGDVGVLSELKTGEEVSTGFDMINDYIVWDQISSGSQGATFEVIDTRGGGKRCMKVVRRDLILHRSNADDNDSTKDGIHPALGLKLHREVAIMKRLRHPNIVQLHEVIDDPTVNSVYMFMDLVDGGPLCKEVSSPTHNFPPQPQPSSFSASSSELGSWSLTLHQKKGSAIGSHRRGSLSSSSSSSPPLVDVRFEPIPFDKLVRYAHQIAGGLRYLHRHGIAHRDVKPDNILIDNKTNKAVIVDFGVSESNTTKGDPMVVTGGAITGTPAFVAPELWDGGGSVCGMAADVWSLGVTLFVASTGFLPFVGGSTSELRESIMSSAPNKFPTNWWATPTSSSESAVGGNNELYVQWESIVMSLLDKNVSSRLTLTDLIQHPLFVATGVVSPPPPPSTTTFPNADVVRQGSPTSWARQQKRTEHRSNEEHDVLVDSTPSPHELQRAIDSVRAHRHLSLAPSSSILFQPTHPQQPPQSNLPPDEAVVPRPPPTQRAPPSSKSTLADQ